MLSCSITIEPSFQALSLVSLIMFLYFNNISVYFSNVDSVVRYRHIGIYGFRRDYLFEFASQERTYLEKCENLEQLRALENGVKIKVVKTDYNPLSVDTLEDLQNILKILLPLEHLSLSRLDVIMKAHTIKVEPLSTLSASQ